MNKKQKAALAAAIVSILTAIGASATALSGSNGIEPRVREVEKVQAVQETKLDVIQKKLDEQSADIKELLRRVK